MTLDIQFKIKNNPLYKRYLREHSYWYKILTRNPSDFIKFEEEVKDFYKLRPVHRIGKMLETIELVQSFMSALK